MTSVKVALKRNRDNRWWTGSGSSGFGTTFTQHEVTVANPGATSTGWTWDWTPKANNVAGAYTIQVQARDAAGNIDSSLPNVVFNMTTEAPDTVAPDTTVTAPGEGATLPSGNVTIAGGATDDRAVSGVRLAIQNGSGQYWTGSAWSATASTVNASVTSGSGTTVGDLELRAAERSGGWLHRQRDGGGRVQQRRRVAEPRAVHAGGCTRHAGTRPDGDVRRRRSMRRCRSLAAVHHRRQRHRQRRRHDGGPDHDPGHGVQAVVERHGLGSDHQQVQTIVAMPGSTSTSWSYAFNPPAAGKYGYQVTAVDAAGNVSAKTAWRTVTMN